MEENLNIFEILKDYPIGTSLYCTIMGECELAEIGTDFDGDEYPITLKEANGNTERFDKYGRYYEGSGECVVFPSKDNRDWHSMERFKEGDIIAHCSETCSFIAMVKGYNYDKQLYETYCVLVKSQAFGKEFRTEGYNNNHESYTIAADDCRHAYAHEKRELLDAMKKNGYHFDPVKHELLKWEPKPFEQVLVRDDENEKWRPEMFSHYNGNSDLKYGVCGCASFKSCIPYKGNEHLACTTNKPNNE